MGASLTDTFLGERYRRIVKRRGHMKALVAVARSILVIVWHHVIPSQTPVSRTSAPTSTPSVSISMKRELRKFKALGYDVTLTPTAARG
ncbi:hypothetical protein OV450_3544 [Actinobacteria bacterium OV450]|nr:hypothetical protein OV450_3544 [Actinobacteria bacterium OV450]